VRTLHGHRDLVWRASFSADGSLLPTAGNDGTARLWRVADGQLFRTFQHGGGIGSASFVDGDSRIMTASGDSLGGILAPLRELSFWKMKQRARLLARAE
jgi:WD40 repeat protein